MMGIDVTRFETGERELWNRHVERTAEAMPFHRHEALEAIADASDTTLHLLGGFKGQEPVGLLPLFTERRGPLKFAYSPPTEVQVPYLGPLLLNADQLKQRKAEQWNARFVDSCLDWIDANLDPDYLDIRTTDRYPDARPFIWNDMDVEPAYTYVVDITPSADDLLKRFSSGVRKDIRDADEYDYTIEEGGEAVIRRVLEQLRQRHEGGDEEYEGVPPEFAVELYRALPDGQMRPYECRLEGEYVGGGVTLESEDTAYHWRGGAKTRLDFPVNELVDWHVMRRAAERGKSRFDLVGAMKPRLCEYKAKFGPEPRVLYIARRRSRRMQMVSSVYNSVPDDVRAVIGV